MFNNNGFEYVDLELPSHTLWATMNVGASKPSDAGLYFQWGDAQGYSADQVGKDKQFASDWSDYRFGASPNFTKYNTAGASLRKLDDAARAIMGGSWHIPSPEQIQELLSNTTNTWTKQDGVNGRLFISSNGKSIFLPAAGYAWDGSVRYSGDDGGVWSSVLGSDDVVGGQCLGFNSGGVGLDYSYRFDGLSVRGVIDKKHDNFKEKKSNMNENLNLVEILKDVPKGTRLWSPIWGECEFSEIINDENTNHPIICRTNLNSGDFGYESFSADGKFSALYKNAECVLFPSKENKDWSTFKVTKKHKEFEPYQKVLVKAWVDSKTRRWVPINYGYYDASKNMHFLSSFTLVEDCGIIPYEGNEDKLGKMAEI